MIILSLSQKPCPFSHHPPFSLSHLWAPSGSCGLLLGFMDLPLLVTTPSVTLSTGSHCVRFHSMFSRILARFIQEHLSALLCFYGQAEFCYLHLHLLFVQFSVDRNLDGFHCGSFMRSTDRHVFISLGCPLNVELLDQMVSLCLTSGALPNCFPKATEPASIAPGMQDSSEVPRPH